MHIYKEMIESIAFAKQLSWQILVVCFRAAWHTLYLDTSVKNNGAI